jgi:GT2 family glycosyltransferase
VPFPGPFNYSAKINTGAFHARGEYLLTLNDDIEVLARGWKDRSLDDVGPSDWLECLLGYATHPEIGAVGAKMYLGDRRLQHVGIVSTSGSVPAHPYRGFHGGFHGYIGNALMPCNYIAVTGACLMTRRDVFDEVGGMSAAFPINYQDVDYGLKLRAQGYRTVYNPEVELFHFESSSRAPDVADAERALLRARWGKILAHDPYYHPGFVEHYADFVHPHYTHDGRFIARSPAA